VVAGDLEGAAGAGRGLLEDQDDLLALQVLLLGAGIFGPLQVAGEIEQVAELSLGEILHRQERAIAQIETHLGSPVADRSALSRPARARSGRSCSVRRRGRGRVPTRAP